MHGDRTVAPALDKAVSRLYEPSPMKLNHLTFALAALLLTATAPAADNDGWISMFNGTDLSGWKSNEEVPGSFSVSDGMLKVSGGRAHIFFTGADGAGGITEMALDMQVKLLQPRALFLYLTN